MRVSSLFAATQTRHSDDRPVMIDKDIPHSLYAKTIHFKNSFILYGLNKLQLPFCFIIGVCNGCVYVLNPALKRWIKCFILRYVKDAVRHIEMSDQ